MADDRPHSADEPDIARAKRPAPTLDLTPNQAPSDAPGEAQGEPAPAEQPDVVTEQDNPPRRSNIPAMVTGALSGAAVAGLSVLLLAYSDRIPDKRPGTSLPVTQAAVDQLAARITALEARPVPTPPPPAAPVDLTPLNARITAAEQAIAPQRDELAALKEQLARIAAAPPAAAPAFTPAEAPAAAATPVPVDLSPIVSRLEQLEASQGKQSEAIAAAQNAAVQASMQGASAHAVAEAARISIQGAVKPAAANAEADAATRRLTVASLLDARVRQGEPFAPVLQAAKAQSPSVNLSALEGFAASGIPSDAVLAKELLAMPQLAAPATSAGSGSWLDRLQQGAARLVRIERTDVALGHPAFSRAASAARRNDVAGAVRELDALPPADRALVQPWLDRVAARDSARLASREFADSALAALSKP